MDLLFPQVYKPLTSSHLKGFDFHILFFALFPSQRPHACAFTSSLQMPGEVASHFTKQLLKRKRQATKVKSVAKQVTAVAESHQRPTAAENGRNTPPTPPQPPSPPPTPHRHFPFFSDPFNINPRSETWLTGVEAPVEWCLLYLIHHRRYRVASYRVTLSNGREKVGWRIDTPRITLTVTLL